MPSTPTRAASKALRTLAAILLCAAGSQLATAQEPQPAAPSAPQLTDAEKRIAASELSLWAAQLKRKVEAGWQIPQGAQGQRVDVSLAFTQDGTVTGASIKTPSANPELDASILKAIEGAMPLPKPGPLGARYAAESGGIFLQFRTPSAFP